MKLIFEKSVPGRRCTILPACDVESVSLPASLRRETKPTLPEMSETDISRHYTELCKQVHGVNCGFYPLGSCTMKYNPRIDEEMAALPGFTGVHPLSPAEDRRGMQQVLDTAAQYLCEITGMNAMTFQPAAGARMAQPGEFTIRAYLAGKLDLSQAEAVADIIASSSRASHALAANQMRGGYSAAFDTLREKLLHLTSLLELELDFSEEEVEFADRTQLRDTMRQIKERIDALRSSFSLGNAIKEGVAVAIVGAPNVGKSTLLNRLLNEERAMVSDIAGTTRDIIEERANIDGIVFRFLDTAGIRSTNDTLEQMGIARTMSSIERAQIIIRLIDASQPAVPVSGGSPSSGQTGRKSAPAVPSADSAADTQSPDFPLRPDQTLLTVYNKIDKTPGLALPEGAVGISARNGDGIDDLRRILRDAVDTEAIYHGGTVISNSRHYEALTSASEALSAALDGLRDNLPTDLLSEEIRQVIRHLSGVTGQDIVPEEVLKTIFSKFCIGK